ncbi:MAG: tyrosine-type recombinase/integrase [Ignavibacteriota bacterium]
MAQRVLGIPFKRARQRAIDYLEYDEIDAILRAINRTTPQGSRDYALLATMFNTGGRVQEIADLRACDLQLTKPFQVRLFGKGRKERYCPLWPQTAAVLRAFSDQRTLDLRSESRVFLNHAADRSPASESATSSPSVSAWLAPMFQISARNGCTPTAFVTVRPSPS